MRNRMLALLAALAAGAGLLVLAALNVAPPTAQSPRVQPPTLKTPELPPSTEDRSAVPTRGKAYPWHRATAAIRGCVTYAGPPPKRAPIDMTADPVCAAYYKDKPPPLSESLIVSDTGAVANAIVFVARGVDGYAFEPPAEPFSMKMQGCRYEPHTFALRAGQPMVIKNLDATQHIVRDLYDRYSRQQAKPEPEAVVTFDEVAVTGLKCDIHPWMNAHGRVFDHPFFCVTGPDGSFELKSLLPGTYTIKAWHLKLKEIETTVIVSAGETRTVAFEYPEIKK